MEFLVNKEDNMRTKRAMLLGVILLLMALLGACAVPAPSAPETVVFADENLDAEIRDALGKPAGEAITPAELAGLTELGAINWGITDLSGIEYCTNLVELNLQRNQISDLSPLASLTKLTYLGLERNQISDISPLVENSGLGAGDKVSIWDNNLDLSEGSEDLENIRQLEGRGVKVHY